MNLTALDHGLWAAGFLGHAALCCVLFLFGRWRTFPIFTALIAFQVANSLGLFLLYRYADRAAYDLLYWVFAVIDFALQLGLIGEIARIVLRPTGAWVQDARRSFLLGSGLAVFAAAAAAFAIKPIGSTDLNPFEIRAILFTSLLTCELFLAMIASANRLGLQWRSHVMALGQGLTLWALVALISDAAHIALGWDRDFGLLDQVRMIAYLLALVFWIVSFSLPERERAPLSPDMQEYLIALHRRVQYDLDRLAESKRPQS